MAAAARRAPRAHHGGDPLHCSVVVSDILDDELRTDRRIAELERIVADPATGIVKRSKAQVKLAQLRGGQNHTSAIRANKIGGSGTVTKNRALVEEDIKRNEKRQHREEQIQTIQLELQNEALAATRSAAETRKLEERLQSAQEEVEALNIEEAEEENRRNSIVKDGGNRHGSQRTLATQGSALADSFTTTPPQTPPISPGISESSSDDAAPPKMVGVPSPPELESSAQQVKASPPRPRPTLERAGNSRLREQLAFLEKENMNKEQRMKQMDVLLEEQEKENGERINQLGDQVRKLVTDTQDQEKLTKHWKTKARRLSIQCTALENDVAQRDKNIRELEEYNRVQEERIITLQAQRTAAPPPALSRPSLSSTTSRRFSTRATRDPSFAKTLKRASLVGGIDEQIREEAKIEMMALEEQLALMDKDKADMMRELETMKAILSSTQDDGKKKKRERLVYQLSCKKCNKHMNFVGTTEQDLKTTMARHFDQVVRAASKSSKKRNSKNLLGDDDDKAGATKEEAWSAEFANHFAKHAKPSKAMNKFKTVTDKDVINFCRANVKVEVLRRSDGAELYWEDNE